MLQRSLRGPPSEAFAMSGNCYTSWFISDCCSVQILKTHSNEAKYIKDGDVLEGAL